VCARACAKDYKKIYHANGNQKEAGVTKFVSDKVDIKFKTIRRN
jgi:hypothetical protein